MVSYDGPPHEKIDRSGRCDKCGDWTDLLWEKEKSNIFRFKIIKVCYKCMFDRK